MEQIKPIKQELINYKGPSMNPILRDGDSLQIIRYDVQKIRRGDVVVFIPPGGDSRIVHRVVSVDSKGIRTRGDNNNQVDSWVLSPEQILGRVFSIQRTGRRRRVFGGTIGRTFAGALRAIHWLDRSLCFLLRPAYRWLIGTGVFRRWVSGGMKIRVLSFKRREGTELQLLWGRHVIGRRLPGRSQWHIRRPFRLFVDEASLPRDRGRSF